MKILYHHRTMAEDGQAVHIRSLQAAFREEGHEVEEVSLVKQGDAGDPKAAKPNEAGRNRWSFVSKLPRFAHELAEYAYSSIARGRILKAAIEFEPDFLYERYAFGNTAGVMAAHRLKKPLVLEVNSPMVLELQKTRGLSLPGLATRMETYIFSEADRVCVVTDVLKDMLMEMGVKEERLLVTPNGVRLELYSFDDPAEQRERARADLGIETTRGLVLGFVGYYRDWHRLDLVIESLTDPRLSEAQLVLIGMGPAEDGLRELAAKLGVEDRVHFPGPRKHDAIPGLLSAFDIALVPAINPYASPLKLHEYMAAGLAVIAPGQPNLREVLTDRENGLLIQPGERDALLAALITLASDDGLRAELGARALGTIREMELTWTGNARRVVQAVGELI